MFKTQFSQLANLKIDVLLKYSLMYLNCNIIKLIEYKFLYNTYNCSNQYSLSMYLIRYSIEENSKSNIMLRKFLKKFNTENNANINEHINVFVKIIDLNGIESIIYFIQFLDCVLYIYLYNIESKFFDLDNINIRYCYDKLCEIISFINSNLSKCLTNIFDKILIITLDKILNSLSIKIKTVFKQALDIIFNMHNLKFNIDQLYQKIIFIENNNKKENSISNNFSNSTLKYGKIECDSSDSEDDYNNIKFDNKNKLNIKKGLDSMLYFNGDELIDNNIDVEELQKEYNKLSEEFNINCNIWNSKNYRNVISNRFIDFLSFYQLKALNIEYYDTLKNIINEIYCAIDNFKDSNILINWIFNIEYCHYFYNVLNNSLVVN